MRELDGVRPQAKDAEQLFTLSAEQNASSEHLPEGDVLGAAILAAFCGVAGWLLYEYDLSATIGVAFPAGALGAAISVLERLTSGSLDLDFRAPARRVGIFGGVRPFISAVFGMVLDPLLSPVCSGLSVDPPAGVGHELAFLAFLAS